MYAGSFPRANVLALIGQSQHIGYLFRKSEVFPPPKFDVKRDLTVRRDHEEKRLADLKANFHSLALFMAAECEEWNKFILLFLPWLRIFNV